MKSALYALLASAFLALNPGGVRADIVSEVLGCADDPCVIHNNPGGEIVQFMRAAHAIKRGARERVVIDGDCYSACVIFADRARAHVCITRRARFGLHKGYIMTADANGNEVAVGRTDPPHSSDIRRLIMKRGGFPYDGFRVLRYREARRFWRAC